LLLLWLLLLFSPLVLADTVVIVNKSAPIEKLSKDDVRSIFLGRLFVFPATDFEVNALDQANSSDLREWFYLQLANKSRRKMNTYWARYLFTGKGQPPLALESDQSIVDMVSISPHTIGYLDEKFVNAQVKVVYRLEGEQ
jgi:ABC-type phosphate transport system substrate-binding protein